jgi:hypothetical protein
MNKKVVTLVLGLLYAVSLYAYFFLLGHKMLLSILYLCAPALAMLGSLYPIKKYGFNNPNAKALLFCATGLLCWLIGELLFFLFDFILHIQAYPSAADFFFLGAYPFLFIGFIKIALITKIKLTQKKMLIALVCMLLLSLVVVYFSIIPAYSPTEKFLNNAVAVGYGIGDLFIISAAFLLLSILFEYQKGKLFGAWIFVLIGLFCTFGADIIYAIHQSAYENGDPLYRKLDLIWIAGYLFIAYGFYSIGDIITQAQDKILKHLNNK